MRDEVLRQDAGQFSRFVRLMEHHPHIWPKVSRPERLTVSGRPALHDQAAPYRDVEPFACLLVQSFPDRLRWGTDWPHPNLKDHMPDAGLPVDNPMRLHWPEEPARAD
jgi:2-pyrone-4,6-dicarboxylate lactonase